MSSEFLRHAHDKLRRRISYGETLTIRDAWLTLRMTFGDLAITALPRRRERRSGATLHYDNTVHGYSDGRSRSGPWRSAGGRCRRAIARPGEGLPKAPGWRRVSR